MVFSSHAPEVRLEFDSPSAGTYDPATDTTLVSGRVVVRVSKAVAPVHSIRVEFLGEETVNLRAWVPLSSTTVSRQVVSRRLTVHSGGVLHEGQHTFAFRLRIPPWVPSSLDRDLCRIRYLVRAVVERPLVVSAGGSTLVCEEEIECRRLRASRRLARRKRIDQSVGCPDGSCHVRFSGSISRDVVRPGAQIKVDVVARTSDARYGLRLLAANFAECVMCHVQVKGEERLVNKITNLVACRLDALPPHLPHTEYVEDTDVLSPNRGSMRSDPGSMSPLPVASAASALTPYSDVDETTLNNAGRRRHLTRGIRKTRSRLAVLLRSTSPSSYADSLPLPSQPDMPGSSAPSQPGLQPHSSQHINRPPLSVVRQIRASQVIQVPLGLSQFSSEYISREYRIMIVAEVAPLFDPEANGNSVHTNDPTAFSHQQRPPPPPPPPPPVIAAPLLHPSAVLPSRPRTAANKRTDSNANGSESDRRRNQRRASLTPSSPAASLPSSPSSSLSLVSVSPPAAIRTGGGGGGSGMDNVNSMEKDPMMPAVKCHQAPSPRWTVSEHSSAIAGWPVDVVERFDVRFDELLVSPDRHATVQPSALSASHSNRVPPPPPCDAELTAGAYSFLPPTDAAMSSAPMSPPMSLSPDTHDNRHQHRSVDSLRSQSSNNSGRPNPQQQRGHHRRTSSGLVGFLMRGFRSNSAAAVPCASPSPSPSPSPAASPHPPPLSAPGGGASAENSSGVGLQRRRQQPTSHVRSVSSVVHGSSRGDIIADQSIPQQQQQQQQPSLPRKLERRRA
ncbi:hypothetical protein GGI02_002116 [Coemansia sp. RSA 2322]|nr:hypothetical protein GGI02_002116 [Coemansia sp. RSA 2322]